MANLPIKKVTENLNASGDTPFNSASNRMFERIAAVATASGFALVMGSAACVGPAGTQGLAFHWHWSALILGAVGLVAGWHLWSLIWRVEADPKGKPRRRLSRYCVALGIGAVLVFAYPFRFVAPDKFRDVLLGLAAAIAVLSLIGWMIIQLVKGFSEDQS
jgi:hypothetical protein